VSFFTNSDLFGSFQALDDNGEPIPFARLTFWEASTTKPASVFGDDLSLVVLNDDEGVVISDADGTFPLIYMAEKEYRVRLETDTGILRWDVSPYRCDCGDGPKLFRSPVYQSLTAPLFTAPSISGATLEFTRYDNGESAPIYADADRTVNLPNPITTNAAGFLPVVYLDDDIVYRIRIEDDAGAELADFNPYACVCGTVIEYRNPGEYFFNPNFGGTDVLLDFVAIGAGAGGGSGSTGTPERARTGGGGGGGGGKSENNDIPKSAIEGGVLITVGAGGNGGAAVASSAFATGGIEGNDGGDTTIGSLCVAHGGKRGQRGIVAGDSFVPLFPFGAGGTGNVSNGGAGGLPGGPDSHPGVAGASSTRAGGGGGGAGGKDSGLNYGNPANGGAGNTAGTTIRDGGVSNSVCQSPGGAGESTSNDEADGGGGGAGAAPTCTTGQIAAPGGDGGRFGGGGGGGGMADATGLGPVQSGRGGNGGGGYARVAIRSRTFYRLTEDGTLRVTEAGVARVTEEA
jgi:hypothetical protein